MINPRNDIFKSWIPLVFLVVVAVGFFIPFSRGLITGFLVKGFLFLIVFILIYVLFLGSKEIQKSEKDRKEDHESEYKVEEVNNQEQWKGFGRAFRRYYQNFLEIVQHALVASGVAFYLKKGKEGLEFQLGITEQGPVDQKMLVQTGSLVDYVAKQKQNFLEGNLSIGTTLTGIQGLDIRSFLGVPLIWEDNVVGVLAVGSGTVDNFGEDDRVFLNQCATLITQMMMVYHQGLRWEMDQKIYQVHLDLEKSIEGAEEEEMVVLSFEEHIKQLIPFDRFTFCVPEGEEGVIRYVIGQIDEMDKDMHFPLDDGLNGWILKRNSHMIIEDMQESNVQRPRYHKGENQRHGLRSFIGIPLSCNDQAWASMTFESRIPGQYTEWTRNVISSLGVHLQLTIERTKLMQQLKTLRDTQPQSDSAKFQME